MRNANKHKIAFARLHNIKIIIYDQEGANGLDGLGVLRYKELSKFIKMCEWVFFLGKNNLRLLRK